MLTTLRGVFGRLFHSGHTPLTGATLISSGSQSHVLSVLEENFISRNKSMLSLSLVTAREIFNRSKNEVPQNIAEQLESYLQAAEFHINRILNEEESLQKVSELTNALSPSAKAFIIDIHRSPEDLSCSPETHKELLEYTRSLRDALKDKSKQELNTYSHERKSIYPLSRYLEEGIQALTQHIENFPRCTQINLAGLTTPLRTLQNAQLEHTKLSGYISALSNKLREISIISDTIQAKQSA